MNKYYEDRLPKDFFVDDRKRRAFYIALAFPKAGWTIKPNGLVISNEHGYAFTPWSNPVIEQILKHPFLDNEIRTHR